MKRTLLATLVATSFATPAGAAPTTYLEDLVTSAFAAIEEPILVDRNTILIATDETMKAHNEAMRKWSEDFNKDLRDNLTTMYGSRLISGRVVKGAPYSAEVITEANQALADGNVISKKTQGAVYRDGEGRTRQESSAEGKKAAAVYISDPVGGKSIVLMPDTKSAVVRPRSTPAVFAHKMATTERNRNRTILRQDGTEIRIENGVVTVNGKEAKVENGRTNVDGKEIRIEGNKVFIDGKEVGGVAVRIAQPNVVVKTIEDGDGTHREEIRVQVIRNGEEKVTTIPMPPTPPTPPLVAVPPVPLLPPMPGVQTLRFESTAKLGKGVTTQLGTKDFDGVKAEGKSTVWTIAANEIGNRNPISITSETWYSPDLKVTVYSRYADPRTGESIYRLANIRRAEPAAALFTVPADYTEKGRRDKDKSEKDKK